MEKRRIKKRENAAQKKEGERAPKKGGVAGGIDQRIVANEHFLMKKKCSFPYQKFGTNGKKEQLFLGMVMTNIMSNGREGGRGRERRENGTVDWTSSFLFFFGGSEI